MENSRIEIKTDGAFSQIFIDGKKLNGVLDFIRSEYKAGRVCDLEVLLCHCQNKLNGNIDGIELDLDEHLRGVPFKKVGENNANSES